MIYYLIIKLTNMKPYVVSLLSIYKHWYYGKLCGQLDRQQD